MMNENKLVMSPIVLYHGPVITLVQVDWFLEQKYHFSTTSFTLALAPPVVGIFRRDRLQMKGET